MFSLCRCVLCVLLSWPLFVHAADDARFPPPPGWQWGEIVVSDGAALRFGHGAPADARADVLILTGFKEFGEKYFEFVHELYAAGFAVHTLDWRGQGGSTRHPDNFQKPLPVPFERHVADLHEFIEVRFANASRPLLLIANSMGGHLAIRYLREHPGRVEAAALSVPMMDVVTDPVPRWTLRILAAMAVWAGRGDAYLPGQDDWPNRRKGVATRAAASRPLSSDPGRGRVHGLYFRDRPELRVGGPTYAWIHHAFESIDRSSEPGYLEDIDRPVLMGIAGRDAFVVPDAARQACARMPACRAFEVADAFHELWMEADTVRGAWHDAVFTFLAEHVDSERR
ncbi:MAG: alpha/beta hydrolase [Chromatiales bacterium]|nr:alpha/beta hydrolase [Chromatiales bacterium]